MKFNTTSITNGKSNYEASYSVNKVGDVFAFTEISGIGIRFHVGKDSAYYAQAKAAADAAKAAKPVKAKAEAPKAKPEAPKASEAAKPAKAEAAKPVKTEAAKPVKTEAAKPVKAEAAKPEAPKAKPEAPKAKPEAPKAKPEAAKPEAAKSWIGTVITGNGWNIAFDEANQRTRVIFQHTPSKAQLAAIEAAGFYFSPIMQSWNKKLTVKAYKAAVALAEALKAIA